MQVIDNPTDGLSDKGSYPTFHVEHPIVHKWTPCEAGG